MVEQLWAHVWNRKMKPVETDPGMAIGRAKENDEAGEFNYIL
jgi:hypothetical protein